MELNEFIEYDFRNEIYEKNVGDEARTFHKLNKSKPLLSISRILKVFTEFKYIIIPKLNLLPNRLVGQLTHRIIEWYYQNGETIKLDNNFETIKKIIPNDFENFNKLDKLKKEKIINNVNLITKTTIKILNDLKINILASEKYVCNHNYHGYIDLIGIKNNKLILIELKTSTEDRTKYETILQLDLYKKLVQEYIKDIEIDTMEIRFLTTDKKVYVKEIDTNNEFEKINKIYERLLGE